MMQFGGVCNSEERHAGRRSSERRWEKTEWGKQADGWRKVLRDGITRVLAYVTAKW